MSDQQKREQQISNVWLQAVLSKGGASSQAIVSEAQGKLQSEGYAFQLAPEQQQALSKPAAPAVPSDKADTQPGRPAELRGDVKR